MIAIAGVADPLQIAIIGSHTQLVPLGIRKHHLFALGPKFNA